MTPASKPDPGEAASAKWGDMTSDFLPLSTKYTQEQSQNNNLYHLTAPRHLRKIVIKPIIPRLGSSYQLHIF